MAPSNGPSNSGFRGSACPAAPGLVAASVLSSLQCILQQNIIHKACNELNQSRMDPKVPTLLGVSGIPSAISYQPTLATDLEGLQERITTTKKGSLLLSKLHMCMLMI